MIFLKKFRYFSLLLCYFIVTSCQKGDESINPYTEIAQLLLLNYNEDLWDLQYNRESIYLTNEQFNVLPGLGKLTLVNKETKKIDFEGEFEIKAKDTLYIFQPAPDLPITLFRNTQSSESEKKGYVKIKIANFVKSLTNNNEPIKFVFKQAIEYDEEYSLVYSEKGDTIANITNQFTENYAEIPLLTKDISEDVPPIFQIEILNNNNQPLLKDGMPIKLEFGYTLYKVPDLNGEIEILGPKIYTSYLSDESIYDTGSGYFGGSLTDLFMN